MTIKHLFPVAKTSLNLDFANQLGLDPRITFTRSSIGTYTDANGVIRTAAEDEPRFDYDGGTGESLGLLLEESRTNLITYSENFSLSSTLSGGSITSTSASSPSGSSNAIIFTESALNEEHNFKVDFTQAGTCTASVFVKPNGRNFVFLQVESGGFRLDRGVVFDLNKKTVGEAGAGLIGSIERLPNDFCRISVSGTDFTTGAPNIMLMSDETTGVYTGDGTSGIYIWGAQLEAGSFPTSYIPTSGSTVARAQDLLTVEAPLPATGSVYIDARAIEVKENDTLLSLKNDSNDKIDLAYLSNTATYNSLALIASYDGISKSSLPLPAPTTDRERNIITYGVYNYQYGRYSSRFAPSLSSSVPTGLNQLSIGHDAVDPIKAFNGYINTVYVWSGELTPEVAEALVRGEIDAINADTYSPTGPAGSLTLVINTQGVGADGGKTFTLPAKSVANDNDIVITWGDGTESGLEGAAAELGAVGLTHDYPTAGIYPVWVEGKMENIRYNNINNPGDLLLIAAWGTGDMLTSPSTMNGAFYGCSQMDFSSSARTTNRPDTSAVTDWTRAFQGCSSITGTFPSFDFTSATNFSNTWNGCSSLASMPAIFVADGSVTQNVTNFNNTWGGCTELTSFPAIDTSNGTNFGNTWSGCSGLTSFPSIDTSSGTNFAYAWRGCGGLTSFPLLNTSSGASFDNAWSGCGGLTSFPLIDTGNGTIFDNAWGGCRELASFPLIDTSSGTNFNATWINCSRLTSFPAIDTSNGTNFRSTWGGCTELTSFPAIDTSSGTSFRATWQNCRGLISFPAGFFDSWAGTPVDECFYLTWSFCTSLTATSADNILVSIAASGVSAPSGTNTNDKRITIDYDGTTLPGTTAAAITTLKSRNWEIYLNNVLQ